MCNPLLTVAVPVYNVEKYLQRCLDSLVKQEYNNMEILLVDDGSEDGSGKICDDYASKYKFIRVIHQTNHGLAYVRNVCIKEAQGEYISFIDSDDFLYQGAYNYLMKIVKEISPDIVSFGYVNVYEGIDDCENVRVNQATEQLKHYSAEQAFSLMLISPSIDVITCNKIIRKSLYTGIEYPIGKLYEDMFTNYKIIARANTIVTTNQKFYIYCHRGSSIGGAKFTERTMDLDKAVSEVHDYGLNICKKHKDLNIGYLAWRIVVVNTMIRSDHKDLLYVRDVQNYAKRQIPNILTNEWLSTTRKCQMCLFAISFPIYKIIYLRYIRTHRQY